MTLPDPWDGMPPLPGYKDELFVGCATFQEIDGVFLAFSSKNTMEDIHMQWAAQNRGRALRAAGVPGTPTALPEHNHFRDAQNVAELVCLWELSTEEPPGDGELSAAQLNGWLRHLRDARDARLAELRDAGLVSPNLSFRR